MVSLNFLLLDEQDKVAVVTLLVIGELTTKVSVSRLRPLVNKDVSVWLSVVSRLECILAIACALKAFVSYLDL